MHFDTDLMSDEFQIKVLQSFKKTEISWAEKDLRCKLGFHNFWIVYVKGIIAATAFFTCIRCYKKTTLTAGEL